MTTAPSAEIPRPAGHLALPALFLGAGLIAFAPLFVRLSELGPTATALHRALLALPLLWAWMAAAGPGGTATPNRRDKARMLLAGLFFAGDLFLWHWSVVHTSIANATLFANLQPVFVTLGAVLLFGARVTPTFLAGLALALVGTATVIGDSLTLGGDHLFGDLLGVGTAVFYAAYLLAIGRARARFPVRVVMAWSTLGTMLGLLPLALLSGQALWPPTLFAWAILLGLAWGSHCGGQGLIAYALAHLAAPFSAASLLVQPVLAAALAWLVLGEALGPWQAAGAAVVLAGLYIARRGSQ